MSNFFGDRLRTLRGTRTKAAFARMLGIPAPMYHRYETGQIPKHEKLEVIATHCGVTIDWLLASNAAEAPVVAEDRAPYPAPAGTCRYPADCDLQKELADVKQSLADMKGQMSTLLGLLGAPLRKAYAPPGKPTDARNVG